MSRTKPTTLDAGTVSRLDKLLAELTLDARPRLRFL